MTRWVDFDDGNDPAWICWCNSTAAVEAGAKNPRPILVVPVAGLRERMESLLLNFHIQHPDTCRRCADAILRELGAEPDTRDDYTKALDQAKANGPMVSEIRPKSTDDIDTEYLQCANCGHVADENLMGKLEAAVREHWNSPLGGILDAAVRHINYLRRETDDAAIRRRAEFAMLMAAAFGPCFHATDVTKRGTTYVSEWAANTADAMQAEADKSEAAGQFAAHAVNSGAVSTPKRP